MAFPPRTQASDAVAAHIRNALAGVPGGVPSGGANRAMCTVVTAGDPSGLPDFVAIATSGANAMGGTFRSTLHNLFGNGRYAGISYAIVGWSGRDRMTNPLGSGMGTAPGLGFQLAGNRDCSEPRALEEMAGAGHRPTGMTTFWWGNNANPYPDPPGAATHWARPCEVCMTNERWIMRRIDELLLVARGASQRSLDI